MTVNLSPLKTVASTISRQADRLLLGVLSLTVFASLLYLLIPQPQMTFHLDPLPSHLAQAFKPVEPVAEELAEGTPEVVSGEALDMRMGVDGQPSARSHTGKRHDSKPKVPKAIPVVNLNTASAQLLEELPGVGPKMAERILKYRKGIGKFQTIEEIRGVKGVGPKVFAKMKPYLKI